jgi:hypothetical protein
VCSTRLAFALIAIDTGVLRGLDPEQLTWLRGALEASRGKLVMAILGHPFFARRPRRQWATTSSWRSAICCARTVSVSSWPGDTHDLEYYEESLSGNGGPTTVHHWVNGGGGAYLSFGSALSWPVAAGGRHDGHATGAD